MDISKKIKLACVAALVGIVSVFAFIVVTKKIDLRSIRGYTIVSGSMVPKIPLGSVVMVYPVAKYEVGDIVSFKSESDNSGIPTTHRLSKSLGTDDNSKEIFETKGDVNNAADLSPLKEDQIIGKVFITVPYLGYLSQAAKTQKGYIFLIIVPSTIVIYEEIKSLTKDLVTFAKSKLQKKRRRRSKPSPSDNKDKLLLLFPLVFGATFFVPISRSFFSDTETSATSSFSSQPDFGLIGLDFISTDDKSVQFKLRGKKLRNYTDASYLITYGSDQGEQGIVGDLRVSGEELESTKLSLGTCSGEDCMFPLGIGMVSLKVSLSGDNPLSMAKTINVPK